jgi:hypothetical protein
LSSYAASGQVGFISFARIDSQLLDAGTHPINALQQHSMICPVESAVLVAISGQPIIHLLVNIRGV